MNSLNKNGIEFDNLPNQIKAWLGSARLTHELISLDKKLGLTGTRGGMLSDIVYNVATTALDPKDVVSEIALGLGLSDSSSKIVAEELEKIAFHPIEEPLRDLGVDISLLHFGTSIGALPKEEGLFVDIEEVDESAAGDQAKTKYQPEVEPRIEARTTAPTAQRPTAPPAGPFILHAEKEDVKPTAGAFVAPGAPERPTFTIKIPITQKKYYSAPQVTAKIEVPGDESRSTNYELREESKNKTPEIKKPMLAAPPMRPLSEIHESRIMNHELREEKTETEKMRIKAAPPSAQQRTVISDQRPVYLPAPIIKKVVHYSSFFTPLDES